LTELGWKVDDTKEIGSDFQEIAKLFEYRLFLYHTNFPLNGDKITTECSIFDHNNGETVFIGSIEDKDFF
jgi:hypothetical protein